MRSKIFALLALFSAQAFAGGEKLSEKCNQALKNVKEHVIEVNAPGLENHEAQYLEEAKLITELASKLGLETPPHQLNFVPSGQLDLMAASPGTHPAPHWVPGVRTLRSLESVKGVLEFVTPGCPTCRSYHSASSSTNERRSIMQHVQGHNDMGATSDYIRERIGDGPLAGAQLAETMAKAYQENDHDNVSLFYQYLISLEYLQDFTFGTFESPSKFTNSPSVFNAQKAHIWDETTPSKTGLIDALKSTGKDPVSPSHQQWSETYSVLQALTQNLPPETPEWQESIFKLYEQANRSFPGVMQTKIMNEGWATLMQYVIARHLPWVDSKDLVQYAQLMSGVAYPSFDNPYWLGVTGWWNLYEKFMERPEIKSLSELEKDHEFVKWAREFYRSKNDAEWAKAALDQRWIEKMRFFLYRKTADEELDQNVPPEKQEYIALSRDWKRIRNFIISKHVHPKNYMIPAMKLVNPVLTPGFITLRQDTSFGLPLEPSSAAKTSFVIAQVLKKPVVVEALFYEGDHQEHQDPWQFLLMKAPPPPPPKLTTRPYRFTVFVDGKVKVEAKNPDGTYENHENDAHLLEAEINNYKDDVLASFHDGISEEMSKQWGQLAAAVGDANSARVMDIVEFAPHSSAAFREYLQLVELRLKKAMQDAVSGKTKAKFGDSSIAVKVLPEIPHYTYLDGFRQRLISLKPIAPVDYRGLSLDHDFDVDDNGTMLGIGPQLPGDKFGQKKDEQNGDGDGEGDGDGKGKGKGKGKSKPKKGEGEGDEPGVGVGGGAGNPSDLQIPLRLYGEILSEILELPNIRRTQGKNVEVQSMRRGHVSKPNGNVLWDHTVLKAIEKARAIRKAKGLPYDATVPMTDLMKEALPLVEPSDYVVSGRIEKDLPDFDAVIVINVDLTGSMGGNRIELAKQLVYNLKALLSARYKNVTVRYVGFDTQARELTEEEIFSQFFGGGTAYATAMEADHKILSEYSNSKYNKYALTLGDAETGEQDLDKYMSLLRELVPDLQYAGFVVTNESDNVYTDRVKQVHAQLRGEWPWVGFGVLRKEADMVPALRGLFPKGNQQ